MLLDENMGIDSVISRGRIMVRNKGIVVRGTFEKRYYRPYYLSFRDAGTLIVSEFPFLARQGRPPRLETKPTRLPASEAQLMAGRHYKNPVDNIMERFYIMKHKRRVV